MPYYNRRQVYTSSIVIRYFFSEIQIVLKFDRYLHSSADFRNSVFEKKLMLTANIVFVAFEFKFGYSGVLNIYIWKYAANIFIIFLQILSTHHN